MKTDLRSAGEQYSQSSNFTRPGVRGRRRPRHTLVFGWSAPHTRNTTPPHTQEGCAHTHIKRKKRGPAKTASPHSKKKFGSVLLSHTLPSAVPSAQSALATGFGMLPGVSLTLSPPKHYQHTTHHPPQAMVRTFKTTKQTRTPTIIRYTINTKMLHKSSAY
jgi:hypothetical protein